MSHLFSSTIQSSDVDAQLDGFGRKRVSEPFSLFESQLTLSKAEHLWDEQVIGVGASSTHLPLKACVRLRVGTAAGEKAVRQSRQYMRYQPGKSQFIMMTGVLGDSKTGVRQRIGYFDEKNGLFFEQGPGGMAVVSRSNTTGTPVETRATQDTWNRDKLDGTGASGIKLDPSKTQIFVIDFEWLGVGRVRFGFVIDGVIFYFHEFLNANTQTEVFMSTPHLPCRYEIENIATSASPTDLYQICSTVSSEGGYTERGITRQGGSGAASKKVDAKLIPLVSFRLTPAFNRATVWPLAFDLMNTSSTFLYYQIILRGTLTGAAWIPETDIVEKDVSATSVTGGLVIGGGYVSKDVRVASNNLDMTLPVCADINGTTDIITIAAYSLGGSSNIYAGMTWKELF